MKSDRLPEAKKPKIEKTDETEENDKIIQIKKQNDLFFKFRDELKSQLKKKDIDRLLMWNNQQPLIGDSEKLLDQAADLLAFGAIQSCSECKSSQFTFNKSGYICNGNISEWTKCYNLVTEPVKSTCKVPKDLAEMYDFLNAVQEKPTTRIFNYHPPSKHTIYTNLMLKKVTMKLRG